MRRSRSSKGATPTKNAKRAKEEVAEEGEVEMNEESNGPILEDIPLPDEKPAAVLENGDGEEDGEMVTEEEKRERHRDELFKSPKAKKFWKAIKSNMSDFTSWTCLLQTVEQEERLDAIREAYDAFLDLYPYCYGYWKKYADCEKRYEFFENAKQVFERGVKSIAISVDLWVHYLNFTSAQTKGKPDYQDTMRGMFVRATDACGREFKSQKLWDSWLEWERAQGDLQKVTAVFDLLNATPTQHYMKNWQKFRDHLAKNLPIDILATEEYLKLMEEIDSVPPGMGNPDDDDEESIVPTAVPGDGEDVIPNSVTNMGEDPYSVTEEMTDQERKEKQNILQVQNRILKQREEVFELTSLEVRKRWQYEDAIKRPYFHVKPLERSQIKNWRDYLDFEIAEGDHEKIRFLFERCLVACALYEDFWTKYLNYIECVSVEETRDVFDRACNIHLRKKYNVHLRWAAFEERQGNADKAEEVLEQIDKNFPGMILIAQRRAGLYRRSGKPEKAVEIFTTAAERSMSIADKIFYYIKAAKIFAKWDYNKDLARELLWKAVELDRSNKRIYLQLFDLDTQYGAFNEVKLEELFDVIDNTESLSAEFREMCWQRRVEMYEENCDDVNKILAIYDRYQKRHKKSAILDGKSSKASEPAGKKAKDGNTVSTSAAETPTDAASQAFDYGTPMQGQWGGYATANADEMNQMAGAQGYYGNWNYQYASGYPQQ